MAEDGLLRIGELSRRSGVSAELLRAWERRYGLLEPARSAGGLRLYSPADLDRVHTMRRHLASGLAAAEAAALARRPLTPPMSPAALRNELAASLDRLDEPAAQAVLDRALAVATVDALVAEILLPYLRELGDRWERGEASIAHEHFASGVLRGRLLGLARGWGLGGGPVAVLACPTGEQHDLGLLAFGLVLRARGWRIVFLGADTPLATIEQVCREVEPELVVLAAVQPVAGVDDLARRQRVAVGGPAAATLDPGGGVLALTGDPVAEADRLTTGRRAG